MKQFSYKGYVVEQFAINHDVVIKKDGKLVFHGQYTRVLTEFELYKVVDDYIKMLSEEPEPYDEKLAEYLMEQGVITEPCKVGDEVFFIELGRVKCGKYLAASRDHVIVTMHNLIRKPFSEQLKDMYDNRYVKIAILKNEDAYLTKEDAEKVIKNDDGR
jgi:translation initiation factor 2 beta subunit (eIF-2beta)/eIF-5